MGFLREMLNEEREKFELTKNVSYELEDQRDQLMEVVEKLQSEKLQESESNSELRERLRLSKLMNHH